ncbi:MAG TPA: tRNA (N6-threonylcarbamoyladenosine(37)-N6)-methyltransferase TrmO [Phycisphaerae bacterium]|nr:tRNA (N6-threonylcarbamoyladenosine(37)-N6)-methyltransferase TrmO [Phycisphaerae bacterium]HRR86372.1 tRNA (N6-threonylcarbamoyladenosine(37)-N6)-methyltransferase TrmO [Phycisphaerae bacterium]
MPQDLQADSRSAVATAFTVRPIGYVHSTYSCPEDVPHSHRAWTEDACRIRLLRRHANGLRGLEGYSHVIVLFWVHRAREWKMPRHHHKPPHVKVFATRMPVRPNPIGMSVVELVEFNPERGDLVVRGLDALDATPVLDIKPYIPNFDSRPDARLPRWVAEHLASHFHGGHEHKGATPGNDPGCERHDRNLKARARARKSSI